MASNRTIQSHAVTRTEFESFVKHVDHNFDVMNDGFRELGKKLDQRSQPQYGLLLSLLALILTVIGGAAFVVTSQIEGAKQLAEAKDEVLQQQIKFQQQGNNRYTLTDHRAYDRVIDERFDESRTARETLRTEVQSIKGSVHTIEARLSTWVDELQNRGDLIRNLGTSIARIDALVGTLINECPE